MQEILVLTSPPASGKTYWIDSFAHAVSEEVLVVSPLRALADECKAKWGDKIKVVTHEEWLIEQRPYEVVIFDEFHLHFYWGDTFRHALWEAFYGLSYSASLTILLTATLSQQMLDEMVQFQLPVSWVDLGNRQLKFLPKKYLKAPSKKWISELIKIGPRGKGTNLIFCPYRQEVKAWESELTSLGFRVWSCVGGEAALMREKMLGPAPDFIVSTTVLSHGVNLPSISCIFFLYPLENVDFWIQMVARGGRKGEDYEVFSLENPHGISFNRWTNFLAILCLSFKIRLNTYWSEADQWFLKASS